MGAVAIIALAYTDQISTIALGGAALVLGLLYVLGKSGVRALPVYAIGVVALWYCVLLSGVHATIAGVAAALVIPITPSPGAPETSRAATSTRRPAFTISSIDRKSTRLNSSH